MSYAAKVELLRLSEENRRLRKTCDEQFADIVARDAALAEARTMAEFYAGGWQTEARGPTDSDGRVIIATATAVTVPDVSLLADKGACALAWLEKWNKIND